jgi:hypothetical protein
MRIAALIFGILAGLSSLPLAQYAHALVGLGGGKDGSLLYFIPLLSFLGAGLAINFPLAAAGLLGLCAAILLIIGGNFGYAINIITIGPVLLNGLGALLALIGHSSSQPDLNVGVAPKQTGPDNFASSPTSASPSHSAFAWKPIAEPQFASTFDRTKWNALVKYDDDIGRVAEEVRKLGDKWVDVLAADYLALGDKSYLPQIIRKILEDSARERKAQELDRAAASQESERQREAAIQESRRQQDAALARSRLAEARKQAIIVQPFNLVTRHYMITTSVLLAVVLIAAGIFYATRPPTYGDAFAFCKSITTTDPFEDARPKGYIGDDPPPEVLKALGAESIPYSIAWRCNRGELLGCYGGASGRACAKRDRSRTPASETSVFCAENPHASPPMSLVGTSAYEWECQNGRPVIVKNYALDESGFMADTWQKVNPLSR